MVNNGIVKYAGYVLFFLLMSSCTTYYQKNEGLMDAVFQNNFAAANKLLSDDASWEKHEKNKLLFYLNKGTVLWMQDDYAGSNNYFRKADFFIEDFQKNYGQAFLSLLVNPNVMTYPGEDYEQILIHYYGALNYLNLGNYDEALVEGKRMLQKMQRITDKYNSKNKYKRDAFAHNLIGMIYDAKGDYNNAFIAYRNAYEVYKDDYQTQLNTPIPKQLKMDMLRTAYLTGFYDDEKKYEAEFQLNYDKNAGKDSATVLIFWNNGLCPVKDQYTLTFVILPLGNGMVEFYNAETGFRFPFYMGDDPKKKNDLLNLKIVRMAIPKFISRETVFKNAVINSNYNTYNFNVGEDINAIAFKSLNDRMFKELGEAILRVALKQLAIAEASKNEQNSGLALAATLYSAFSEQADTRNWQLLPSAINYCRITVPLGQQSISFTPFLADGSKGDSKHFEICLKKGETHFLTTQTPNFKGFVIN